MNVMCCLRKIRRALVACLCAIRDSCVGGCEFYLCRPRPMRQLLSNVEPSLNTKKKWQWQYTRNVALSEGTDVSRKYLVLYHKIQGYVLLRKPLLL